MTDLLKTPLFTEHQNANAKIVDFGGWALPVNYGSQIEEHQAVRTDCGMFDVSHMTVSDITGPQTLALLSHLLANDIAKVSNTAGKALYSCMLNEQGGVIDDLIVYYLNDQHCRLVTNAGTNEKDMAWISQQAANFEVVFQEQKELALIAVQGPNALTKCAEVLPTELANLIPNLARFQGAFSSTADTQSKQFSMPFIGRTGYTGEDGVELIIDAKLAVTVWQMLIAAKVQPCGLGARDTLRLESGMSLYGNDLDEQHTPLESGLAWSVAKKDERDFIGKQALLETPANKMIGLILLDRGVLRGHQKVILDDKQIGETTSGTFSPSLNQSIALARISSDATVTIGDHVKIEMRNKQLNAVVARQPFFKDGASTNPTLS